MNDPDARLLLVISLLVGLAFAGWYFRDHLLPQPPEPEQAQPVPAATIEAPVGASPEHPIVPLPAPEQGALVPLPPLDDSDGYFLLTLNAVLGADVGDLLVKEALIDKFVATVDNLPRGHVAEKIRPVGRLGEAFRADPGASNGIWYLSADNYARYDPLVRQLASADIEALVDTYRRFYPLFQESYERLGYPDAYFNDRVVEVIDHLLATPATEQAVRLVRPHVLYEYADPDLEDLSSGQKLLLRMGSEHAQTVKDSLREIRNRIAGD